MGTTPTYGLRYPEPTDKVTDGALAIRNLAEDVEADLATLLPKTGKAADSELLDGLDSTAFLRPTVVDAKGDLIAGSGLDTVARLPVGADGQVLTADAAAALGVKWANATSDCVRLGEAVMAVDTASVEFTNIPQTFRHLLIVGHLRGAAATLEVDCAMRLNGDTASTWTQQRLRTIEGTTAPEQSAPGGLTQARIAFAPGADGVAGSAAAVEVSLPHYTGTTLKKSYRSKSSGHAGRIIEYAGYWASSVAITSLTFFPETGNFQAGSALTLYGLR